MTKSLPSGGRARQELSLVLVGAVFRVWLVMGWFRDRGCVGWPDAVEVLLKK